MLFKRIDFIDTLPDGSPGQQVIFDMTKTAGCVLNPDTELLPEIKEYISQMKPDKNKVYILAVAVAVGEFWGSNKNGDLFRYEQLYPSDGSTSYGYKTLENAKIYIEHDNRPNSPSIGKVIKSFFNHKMGRVEVIYYIERNNKLAQKIVADIDNGILPDVSMGCRVAYDVCTICGTKARTQKERCEHIPRMLNKIFPDGRKCMMDNIKPVFFDLSIVAKRAERIAVSMLKVASTNRYPYNYNKQAAMNKRVPMEYIITPDLGVFFPEAFDGADTIDKSVEIPIDKLVRRANPMSILMTLLMLGIKPSPAEFCQLLKHELGEDVIPFDTFDWDIEEPPVEALPAAQELISKMMMAPIRPDIIPDNLLETRSTSPVFLIRRISKGPIKGQQIIYKKKGNNSIVKGMYTILSAKIPEIIREKTASLVTKADVKGSSTIKNILMKLLMQGYINKFKKIISLTKDISQSSAFRYYLIQLATLANTLKEEPGIEALLYQNAHILPSAINTVAFADLTTKTASNLIYSVGAPVVSLGVSKYLQNKERYGQELTPTQQFIAHHPAITALAALATPLLLEKLNIQNALLTGAAGLAGYGVGQVLSKNASLNKDNTKDIIEDIVTTPTGQIKLAAVIDIVKKTTITHDPVMIHALAAALGGLGLGLMVGVEPTKNDNRNSHVVPYGRFINQPHTPMGLGRQLGVQPSLGLGRNALAYRLNLNNLGGQDK